jgi:hypothetical protein
MSQVGCRSSPLGRRTLPEDYIRDEIHAAALYQLEMQRLEWQEQRRVHDAAMQRVYGARRFDPMNPMQEHVKISDVLRALGLTVKHRTSTAFLDVSHPKGKHKVVVDCGDRQLLDIADAYASGIYLVVMHGKYPGCGTSFGGRGPDGYVRPLHDLPNASECLRFHWGRLHEEDPAWEMAFQAARYAMTNVGQRLEQQRIADAREATIFLEIRRKRRISRFKATVASAISGVLLAQVIVLIITHI